MTLHLQGLDLGVTTRDVRNAGTDDDITLFCHTNHHEFTTWPNHREHVVLDNPWNDRERGQFDLYTISLRHGRQRVKDGVFLPLGIAYIDEAEFERNGHFELETHGDDLWCIESLLLWGLFRKVEFPRGERPVVGHPFWRVISIVNREIRLSTDGREGHRSFRLPIKILS